MEEDRRFLSPWLELPCDNWKKVFAQQGRHLQFPRGSVIVPLGAQVQHLYFLMAGRAQYVMVDEEGNEKITHILEPGNIFGEGPLLTGLPTTVYCRAMDDAVVAALPGEDALAMIRRYPDLAEEVIRSVSMKLRVATQQLYELSFRCAPYRIASLLHLTAAQVRKSSEQDQPVTIAISQQELASVVGVSRVTVTKVLQELKALGLIGLGYRQVTVNDLPGLYDWAKRLSGCAN